MILYYSGAEGFPDSLFPVGADVMYTFQNFCKTAPPVEKFDKIRPKASPRQLFLDSGAFTLWTKAAKYAKKEGCGRWGYYDTKEFRRYCRAYAKFIKHYSKRINLYANLDVIPNPELTYKNQKRLEIRYGLRPVPVVHFTTDPKWLHKYMVEGHGIIGLGGLVGRTAVATGWLDRCFEMVCRTPNRIPQVRIHAFGIVNYRLLIRYPWSSADSAAWIKEAGKWGAIFVPHKRLGKFTFAEPPYKILTQHTVLAAKSYRPEGGVSHYFSLHRSERTIVDEWLERTGVRLGRVDKEGKETEPGVITCEKARAAANLLFFEAMRKSPPTYPSLVLQAPTIQRLSLLGK